MEILNQLKKAVQICFFNAKAIKDVAKYKEGNILAAILLMLSWILIFLLDKSLRTLSPKAKVIGLGIAIISIIVISALYYLFVHLSAKLLGAKKSIFEFFRPSAYSSIILFVLEPLRILVLTKWPLNLIFSIIYLIWGLAIEVYIAKLVYRLSNFKTIALVILTIALISGTIFIVSIIVGLIMAFYMVSTGNMPL